MPERQDHRSLIRVESAEEQYAWMLATFGDPASWRVVSQMFDSTPDGSDVERVEVEVAVGDRVEVAFVGAGDDGFADEEEDEGGTGFLDRVMEAAVAFSQANPPHHPGTLARFPVPSASYANAIAVPMPVLAVDAGRRGLYAPPRVVVLDFSSGEARGVGEFPGFDPEAWPPERLGDWPPPLLAAMHRQQLQGMIMRFSAVWRRVLGAWFAKEIMESPGLTADIRESLALREALELPLLLPYYDRLNPVFARWLQRHSVAG